MSVSSLNLARKALERSPIFALNNLTVEQAGEQLVISGRVSTFYQKQMAQEAIRAVCEGVQLQNSVDVD